MMKAARRTHNDQIKALIARQQRQCRLSVGTALKRRIAGAAGPADRDDSPAPARGGRRDRGRSEEHTSELQSLMRSSYAVFCLTKKKNKAQHNEQTRHAN